MEALRAGLWGEAGAGGDASEELDEDRKGGGGLAAMGGSVERPTAGGRGGSRTARGQCSGV